MLSRSFLTRQIYFTSLRYITIYYSFTTIALLQRGSVGGGYSDDDCCSNDDGGKQQDRRLRHAQKRLGPQLYAEWHATTEETRLAVERERKARKEQKAASIIHSNFSFISYSFIHFLSPFAYLLFINDLCMQLLLTRLL